MTTRRLVPLQLIFSRVVDAPAEWNSDGYDRSVAERWSDVPLVNLEPHMEAATFVLTRRGSLQSYWDWFNAVSPVEARQYAARRQVWEKEVARRISAYARHLFGTVPVVRALDRDRLVLRDGNMRCCVAKVKGRSWIRVDMPAAIAALWDQRPTKPLEEVLARQKRKAFYTPVMHPRYRRWSVNRDGGDRLDMIRRFLGPTRRRLSVLDVGCNTGYYAFHLARQGFEVIGLDYDPKHLEVAVALRTMFGLDVDLRLGEFQTFPRDRRYDVVLGLTVFWHILGWGDIPYAAMSEKELGEQLEALVGHALFWESGVRANDEIDLIRKHSGLTYYTHLGDTEGTGVQRRFGVFTRVPASEALQCLRG